ncbi:MAG: hypothetical protein M1833_003298 [Piccolia ochrophora]|nr:MAG: hypothetical protein M1833_003298 [Piccolia ochrophora]
MTTSPLPSSSLLTSLTAQFPSRDLQIHQLAHLLWPPLPSPSTLVLHGPTATGKTAITRALLSSLAVPHAIIPSAECVTARQLLERTVVEVEDALARADGGGGGEDPLPTADGGAAAEGGTAGSVGRCENLAALATHLERLLLPRPRGTSTTTPPPPPPRKFILVFDGVDRQREAPPTLLPALARLGEMIPPLTTLLILTAPRPRSLHVTGTPHVYFPAYAKDEAIEILCLSPPPPPPHHLPQSSAGTERDEEDVLEALYPPFLSLLYDALVRPCALDVLSMRRFASRLWPAFVAPVVGSEPQFPRGVKDFSRLVVANRGLFQGEQGVREGIFGGAWVGTGVGGEDGAKVGTKVAVEHDLPYYTKFLICAAYLASYNPAKQDGVFFMKTSEMKKRRKGGRKSGAGKGKGRREKHRKIQRHLLGPQTFVLERLLAIFHAILPHPVIPSADIQTQIATLASLRLLVRTSAAADVLEAQTKWRVNVGWEYVRRLARTVGLEMEAYLAE